MGQELWKIKSHQEDMEKLARGILNHAAAIKAIRAEHPHTFAFSYQVNAHHVKFWHVVYHCSGCGELKTERKEPVCSSCDATLKRCDAADTEAEDERKQPEHQGYSNPPIAFRCPACCKIHILRYQGD